jgi:xanthine/CO dehydrogenase XdhC/CoxF family maturation factor
MPSDAGATAPDSRLIHAILAAQIAALRERIASPEVTERLMGCTEVVALLAWQVSPDSAAATTAAALETALDELVFYHAQHQDLARQTADLVAHALNILATAGADQPPALSLSGLSALYVSEDQRQLHEAVRAEHARRLGPEGPERV